MAEIKLLISDFDGTLVDTFEANYRAYKKAFQEYKIDFSRKKYTTYFGLRFDDFMNRMGICDEITKNRIRDLKSNYYPLYFNEFIVNKPLLCMLKSFRISGGMTALASTARYKNLINAIRYIDAEDTFTLILSGEDVVHGKPNPEIYNTILEKLNVHPEEAVVFEDSSVGIVAAQNAGIPFIKINRAYFKNGNDTESNIF